MMRVLLSTVAGVLVLFSTLSAAYAQPAQPESAADMKSLIDAMMYHTQGWGVLGEGCAAHAPDKEGEPLRIGEQTYTLGLGDHAPSETIFMLDGQYLTFEAACGVHLQASDTGTVLFKVFVDDREVFNSGVLRQTDPAKPMRVSLEGASELRLVAEDAGDGITCDMANWVNLVLTSNPAAPARARGASVNIAPFACVAAWDPARVEGTQATRLEPIPADDLFLRTELAPDAQGVYEAKAYADGRSCIGLEWLERRRIKQLAVTFTGTPPNLDSSEIQYWSMTQRGGSPGGSRWQGKWEPLTGTRRLEDGRWVVEPDWSGKPEARTGALKVRWVFPAGGSPVRVQVLHAYTASRWVDTELLIETRGAPGEQASLEMYNGELIGNADPLRFMFGIGEPLRLPVRYSPGRRWELADRTIIRFTLPGGAFGVAVDDVMAQGAVYVEHAGLLVCDAARPVTLDAYAASIVDKRTLLEEVRALPDQTAAQALRHVHRPDADLGPTMLSLACDNRKFIVEREGVLQFDDRPEVFNHIESAYGKAYACRMTPGFGSDKRDGVNRHYDTDWKPVPVLTVSEGSVQYRQRTFVAPFGKAAVPDGAPWYLTYRPLGVAEFTITNPEAQPAEASLSLTFIADTGANTPASIRIEGDYVFVEKNGSLLALVRFGDMEGLETSAEKGVLRVAGSIPAKNQRGLTVYFPRWENAQPTELDAADADMLASDTAAYWDRVMDEAMAIDLPDGLFRNLIQASAMHCMLAARNEDFVRIAPWVGSWNYGPLESEGHSVIRGMMASGHLDFARRALEYYIARYNEDGYLTTGYTVMGTGWHLWTLGEYYRLAPDPDWLRAQAPKIEKVCRWIMAERRKTMRTDTGGNKVPEYGLMPPGVGADWEVYSYYFYLNGYYCAGLRATAEALADIDWPGAAEMAADAAAFEEDIRRAYAWVQGKAPVFPLRNGVWVPEYPTQVYAPCPVGNLYVGEDGGRSWCYDVELGAHHLVPFGILDPKSPQVDWMMDHMEDVQFLHSGWFYYEDEAANEADWFNLGGFAKVQPYYARTGEVYALRDDVKPFVRTYFNSVMTLLNREDLSLWEHFINGAYNKTHETGYYLHQTRLMFVQERGEELWLAPFITNNWLRDGMRVAVNHAPTFFGPVAYDITSRAAEGYITATIEPPVRRTPETVVIRLRHPEGKTIQSAEVTGAQEYAIDAAGECIRIVPAGGTISVRAMY